MKRKRINVPSDRPIFATIDEFFQTEINPYLETNEIHRRRAIRKFVGMLGIIFLVVGFFLTPFGGGDIQLAFFAIIAGGGLAGWILKRASSDISHGLFRLISSYFGFTYRKVLPEPPYFNAFRELKILPPYDLAEFEDEICGVYEETAFTLCEVHLKREAGSKSRTRETVFHGQLLVIDYQTKFNGETVLVRDAGILNRFGRPGKKFQRVGLASSDFEKTFEAWSTDQVEARTVLDPIVLERFLELERLFSGAKLSAAFANGRGLVCLNVGDRLNLGSMFQPLATPERVEKILAEFDLIFDLIEVLTKKIDTNLKERFRVQDLRPPNKNAG